MAVSGTKPPNPHSASKNRSAEPGPAPVPAPPHPLGAFVGLPIEQRFLLILPAGEVHRPPPLPNTKKGAKISPRSPRPASTPPPPALSP